MLRMPGWRSFTCGETGLVSPGLAALFSNGMGNSSRPKGVRRTATSPLSWAASSSSPSQSSGLINRVLTLFVTPSGVGLFQELHRAHCTIVMITHDQGVAAVAERRITMRDGRVDTGADGAPPTNLEAACSTN